nr:BatD family protein [Shewanella intestini]
MLLAITSTLSANALAVTKVQASVDRNPAVVGDYFVLTVTADDDLQAGAFDPSILLKSFIVNRTSVGRSTQIINFKSTKETRWQVILSPKKAGNITIPAFTIDGVSSNPIQLVAAPAGTKADKEQDVFIQGKANFTSAFVGQLITYKVKLFLAADLQRGAINSPVVDGAQVKQFGEDIDSSEIVNGRRFRVIERTYGIIADKPGPLAIKGANFSGDILVESSTRGSMFGFNESRPMQSQAEDIQIDIKPIPASYQGDWLVADIAVLHEKWPSEQTYKVGSPITRTLTLTLTGSDDSSIPEIAMPLPDGLKAYPEKPDRNSFVRQGQVVSQYTITTAIVPTQAGEFTLPEIRVPWWNPRTNKQEFASLPARTITVIADANAATMTPSITQSAKAPLQTHAGFWPWLSAVFALLWLISTFLWLNARRASAPVIATASARPQNLSSLASLSDACEQQDVSRILLCLQRHFSQQMNQSMTLGEIGALSIELKSMIATLQASQYSAQVTSINSQDILNTVKNVQLAQTQVKQEPIVPLNP